MNRKCGQICLCLSTLCSRSRYFLQVEVLYVVSPVCKIMRTTFVVRSFLNMQRFLERNYIDVEVPLRSDFHIVREGTEAYTFSKLDVTSY